MTVDNKNIKADRAILGGPFMIELLLTQQAILPSDEKIIDILSRHLGTIDCLTHHQNSITFFAKDHIVKFKDKEVPIQFTITNDVKFKREQFSDFVLSQMWDCLDDRDHILDVCKYQVMAFNMLSSGLDTHSRAMLEADFVEALAELYPNCEAFYFQNSGKLFKADRIYNHNLKGLDRFTLFGVNVRFFNIKDTNEMLIDTLGMNTIYLPDLQYHFKGLDPNFVVNHAYNMVSYLIGNKNPIKDKDTIDGINENGLIDLNIQWQCRYENSIIQPLRPVIDINMGQYTAGEREK